MHSRWLRRVVRVGGDVIYGGEGGLLVGCWRLWGGELEGREGGEDLRLFGGRGGVRGVWAMRVRYCEALLFESDSLLVLS